MRHATKIGRNLVPSSPQTSSPATTTFPFDRMSTPGNLQNTDVGVGHEAAKISPARRLQPSRQELQDLEHDIEQLRDELRRRDDLLDLINKHRAPYRPLHPIVLRIIFEILVTPSSFLDPSLSRGPHSPWCQTLRVKKGLCLVSRTWGEAAVLLLYGEITLRRVGQLFALARTLRENPNAYTHVIWSITLAFHVPEGYKELVERSLASILIVCPNVRRLSFTSASASWLSSESLFTPEITDNPLAVALRQAGSRITKFEYFDGELSTTKEHYVLPTQLIKTFTGICSLTLLLPPLPIKKSLEDIVNRRPAIDLPPLTLERLETLTLWYRDADNYLLAMAETWKMPRLQSVAFRALDCMYRTKIAHYLKFFQKFGHGLTYLDFGPYMLFRIGGETLSREFDTFLGMCPSLQHLVIANLYLLPGTESLVLQQTPFHTDVWAESFTYLEIGAEDVAKLLSSPDDARYIRPGVRLLDCSLSHIPDLPRLLPPIPNQPPNDPPLVHRMAGFVVVETKWCIFQQSADWDNAWDGLPETFSETMEPYREPFNQDDPWSWTASENSQNETDSDVCSHHSGCRYRLPATDSDSGSSSYFDSDEEDDQDQFRYLEGWQAEVGAPEVPVQELESLVQLTEEDVLEIFTTQVESNRIPRRDAH